MDTLYILTDSDHPNLLDEDRPLLKALARREIRGVPVVWDEFDPPKNAWILIRTPWDYSLKAQAFQRLLDNIDKAQARLVNSTETVRWNLNKEYLCELDGLGIPVVKTRVVPDADLEKVFESAPFGFPMVLKPLVGGAGRDTFLIKDKTEISKCAALQGKDILVQPFIPSIQTVGEYSFIFFNGNFSHAIVKRPKAGEFRVQEEHGGAVEKFIPSQNEIQQAQKCLKQINRSCAYARVDLVEDSGQLLIMELEVIEPQLFFAWSPEAVDRFAEALQIELSSYLSEP